MIRGLFNRNNRVDPTGVTIIAKGNKLSGEMNLSGKLHIDGLVQGAIYSTDSVSIGKRGEVRGVVHAQRITVSGRLEAEVHCQELHVERDGYVCGTVYSRHLSVHRKGCFVGERAMTSDSALMSPQQIDALHQDMPLKQVPSQQTDHQVIELPAEDITATSQDDISPEPESGANEPLADMLDQMLAEVPSYHKGDR